VLGRRPFFARDLFDIEMKYVFVDAVFELPRGPPGVGLLIITRVHLAFIYCSGISRFG
jgi:hypothetical protein